MRCNRMHRLSWSQQSKAAPLLTVFGKQTFHRGAPWSSVGPEDQRVLARVPFRLDVVVVHVERAEGDVPGAMGGGYRGACTRVVNVAACVMRHASFIVCCACS
jgi:hypothetical protein